MMMNINCCSQIQVPNLSVGGYWKDEILSKIKKFPLVRFFRKLKNKGNRLIEIYPNEWISIQGDRNDYRTVFFNTVKPTFIYNRHRQQAAIAKKLEEADGEQFAFVVDKTIYVPVEFETIGEGMKETLLVFFEERSEHPEFTFVYKGKDLFARQISFKELCEL